MFAICALCVFFTVFLGKTSCAKIQQISSLFASQKDNVTINCSHNDSSLLVMLWYQQKIDSTAMALIVYSYAKSKPNYEDGFKNRFELKRQETEKGDLTITNLLQSDSAVYYCAASIHSAAHSYDCRTKTSNTKHTGNYTNCSFMLHFCFAM
ncbi:hypothetical protein SRHO_G00137730 [Serrasalmus rhombeus]